MVNIGYLQNILPLMNSLANKVAIVTFTTSELADIAFAYFDFFGWI